MATLLTAVIRPFESTVNCGTVKVLPNVPTVVLTVLRFEDNALLLPEIITSAPATLANALLVVRPFVVASATAAREAYKLGTCVVLAILKGAVPVATALVITSVNNPFAACRLPAVTKFAAVTLPVLLTKSSVVT